MQLIIDIGNTLIKYYVFEGESIIESCSEKHCDWHQSLDRILKVYPKLKAVIVSDVRGTILKELQEALKTLPVVLCSFDLKLPFTTKYTPSQQLGQDRIALLAACCKLYSNKNVLVIDVGSCITYDFIDQNAVHHGGAISPGFSMRYKSMHDYSGKLPLLQREQQQNNLIGTSTAEAMHLGVFHGISHELQGIIASFEINHKHLTLILTGGDAQMLSKSLKNSIFAHSNFLAEGLNHILAMNKIS